jgi:hypothetical protein
VEEGRRAISDVKIQTQRNECLYLPNIPTTYLGTHYKR